MLSGCMLTVYRFFWSYHVRLIRQPSQPTKQAVQFYWEIISHFNFFPQRKIKLPLKVKNEILHPKFLRGELSSKYFTATAMHRACSSLWFTHQKYWWCSHSNQGQHTTNAAVYLNFPHPLSPEIIGGKILLLPRSHTKLTFYQQGTANGKHFYFSEAFGERVCSDHSYGKYAKRFNLCPLL